MARTTNAATATATDTAVAGTAVFRPNVDGGTDGERPKAIMVRCLSSSPEALRCRVPALHGTANVFLAAGESDEFIKIETKSGNGLIDGLYVSSAAGTATYKFEVTAA